VDILGTKPTFFAETADPMLVNELSEALARGESWEGRLPHRRRDGATVELDLAVAPLRDAKGANAGTVAVARDISRERALETQLAQAQRMEAIGRLAGGIAHDFNNILTAIGGFSELVAAEIPANHPVADDIDQIRKATDRAAALTRALLAFSRRQVMQTRLIDINDVLAGLTPMLGRLIGEDVQLIVRVDPRLGPTLADSAHLEQVVLNLTANARDAMPDGGILRIATANVDIDADFARANLAATEGKYVVLTVSDTGVGMPPEVMEHAFEPFFSTKERGKSTGLGLSTTLGIVQQTGGFMRVESEPSVGSVFSVYLPRIEGAVPPDEAPAVPDRPPGGSETILVAEDEDAVRRFVERVLIGAGYRVTVAAHGAEAIELAAGLPHLDLLFTDVVMPGMNGIQLAAHLTATRPHLPVIYASGYSDQGVPKGVDRDDNASYLPKPFTAEGLLLQIREVLDRRPGPGSQMPPEAPRAE
jgi:signal transduction histidine kinase/CheY-like chemotaxis protein